jgi:CRISPR-associated protein Csy1
MRDPTIEIFFEERKEDFLKKKLKKSMSQEEQEEIHRQCEEKFALHNWLPDAAKRAGQMSMASHPCTFSHPSSRRNANGNVTPVICHAASEPDGFLRCGNVKDVQTDALGNAAALDVYKFLDLILTDGKKLIEHIMQESEIAQNLLNIPTASYEQLRENFLKMRTVEADRSVTSSKIKQVYFPIAQAGEYHLLSILTNSGILFRMREMIDQLRFGEENKAKREARKKGECDEMLAYMDLNELTKIAYGGTKPQNISVLNNRYGGTAYLLRSMPPQLVRRNVRFPRKDFFEQSLPYQRVKEMVQSLALIADTDYNNQAIRQGRLRRYRQLMDLIVDRMWSVRMVADEQYFAETSQLPEYQKIWLLPEYNERRKETDTWYEELKGRIARWIIAKLEANAKNLKLGEAERRDILSIIDEYKEALG